MPPTPPFFPIWSFHSPLELWAKNKENDTQHKESAYFLFCLCFILVTILPRLGRGRMVKRDSGSPGKSYGLYTVCSPHSSCQGLMVRCFSRTNTRTLATHNWVNAWAPSTSSVKGQGIYRELEVSPEHQWEAFIHPCFQISTMCNVSCIASLP